MGNPAYLTTLEGVAVADLTSGEHLTSNAFNFRGRLQEYSFFEARVEVQCLGEADAIYFYFGGSRVPSDENDVQSGAFIISTNTYWATFQMQLATPYLSEVIKFNIPTGVWVPMVVQYTSNSRDQSFYVQASISGTIVMSTTVVGAGSFLNSELGTNWGIGARSGEISGYFSFRQLQVDTGAAYCGAGLVSSCQAGSYSAGDDGELCLTCSAGHYMQFAGATSAAYCWPCAPGTYTSTLG